MGVALRIEGVDRVRGIAGLPGSAAGIGIGGALVGRLAPLPEVAVSPAGHEVAVHWAAVAGATEVEVRHATLQASPPATARIESVNTSPVSEGFQLSLGAHRRLLAVGLLGARRGDGTQATIASAADLDPDRRLVVYASDATGQMAARYAVPRVGARGGIPPQFGGASLDGGVVAFPDLATTRVRVGLVDRSDTEEWAVQPLQLAGQVNATVLVVPADLSLDADDGTTLWAFPGELGDEAGRIEADLAAPLQGVLAARLAQQQPLDVRLSLTASNEASVGLRLSGPSGALVRREPGVVTVELAGAARQAVLAGGPLASERPTSVTADLVVRYAGIRLLDEVNDPMPAGRAVSGTIVGPAPLRRVLPPELLRTHRVARIGIIGRSPEGCELSVQLVDAGPALTPLAPPGVCTVSPSDDLATWWVEVAQAAPSSAPPAIQVRATSGRFFWVGDALPLARLAVHDPDPGNRPVHHGGELLARLTGDRFEAKGTALATAPFAAPGAAFESTLFVTIELGDLTLRYAR